MPVFCKNILTHTHMYAYSGSFSGAVPGGPAEKLKGDVRARVAPVKKLPSAPSVSGKQKTAPTASEAAHK